MPTTQSFFKPLFNMSPIIISDFAVMHGYSKYQNGSVCASKDFRIFEFLLLCDPITEHLTLMELDLKPR